MRDKFTRDLIDQIDEGDLGYSPETWDKIAELGWMEIVFPEKYDGAGMSFLDLALMLEEIARIRPISPFFSTIILGGLPVLDLGNEDQKQAYLPEITAGKTIVTLALLETTAQYDASGIHLRAVESGDGFVLNGSKILVPDGHVADYLICVARTGENTSPAEGITLFIVDIKSPGISCRHQKTLNDDIVSEIVFKNVKVPGKNILGTIGDAWNDVQKILDRAAVAKCCEMVGGAQRVLELSVEHAKKRKQFNRPIGSFQAIQHHCANILSDVDSSRMITYEAAWRISEDMPYAVESAMAKSWTSEAYKRVVHLGVQIHGGSGLITDYDMHRYFKAAKVGGLMFGDSLYHRKLLTERLNDFKEPVTNR